MSSSLFHTLNISRQDMLTRLADLDVISNNIANVNTSGFKSSRSNFQELLDSVSAQREGIYTPSTQLNTNQGALKATQNPFDWAIEGEGFFPVRLPNGTVAYTRDGQFNLDANRTVVTSSGYPLVWSGQTIPADAVNISLNRDGTVEALLADGTKSVVGNVQLAKFANPTGLISAGRNTWIASLASGQAQLGTPGTNNLGTTGGYLVEQSNVSLSREMTNLITDQRAFELSTKAFQQTDTMITQAINLRKI
ncbi:MAG: flagellar hook-basal body complex protein [Anaerolineaceae bacterium]|nr:flagellar hook-basal body complex protein [Anaerolineaceae bacterium]